MFYRLVGDVSSAHTHAVQGVVHLTGDIVPTIRARHLLTLAVALDENGHSADGDRRFQEALDIAMSLGDGELTVHILNNMAYTAYEREDEPLARALTDQMREVEARDSFSLSAGQLDTIARVEMMSGRYDSAAATFREMANRDALTGLYDRRYIDERLPALLGEAASRRPISLAIVDLDHFKRVNDTLSHGVGDTVCSTSGGCCPRRRPAPRSRPGWVARSSSSFSRAWTRRRPSAAARRRGCGSGPRRGLRSPARCGDHQHRCHHGR
jgi:hypothetical protein